MNKGDFDINSPVSATYAYGPFGETVAHTGMDFEHRFGTKPYNGELGTYTYIYRDYSPVLGRWLSEDPILEQGGYNLYAYCGNEPVGRCDRIGLFQVEGKDGKCGKYGAGTIEAAFYSYINNGEFNAIVDNIREPLKTAIKEHFRNMKFVCRCNTDDGECNGSFGHAELGYFRDISYTYNPQFFTGRADKVTVVHEKKWNTVAYLCVDQLVKRERFISWLKTAIHETAHCIGWGNDYIDDDDQSFNNLLPRIAKHPGGWGVPSANEKE